MLYQIKDSSHESGYTEVMSWQAHTEDAGKSIH